MMIVLSLLFFPLYWGCLAVGLAVMALIVHAFLNFVPAFQKASRTRGGVSQYVKDSIVLKLIAIPLAFFLMIALEWLFLQLAYSHGMGVALGVLFLAILLDPLVHLLNGPRRFRTMYIVLQSVQAFFLMFIVGYFSGF
jgi:hypothetical protein